MTRIEMIDAYRGMCRIRTFEEEVLRLTAAGMVPGFVHPCFGHEAIAVGVLASRNVSEWVVSHYRCHGHALACGADPLAVLREILGRRGGLSGGKGGSTHLADRAGRFLGASSIVAAQLPMAAGVAMNEQHADSGRAVIVFCADGALGAVVAYETMAIARTRGLPLLVVCEDSGWQDHTPSAEVSSPSPARLCAGLDLRHREVDGNDVAEVNDATVELLDACRSGDGPGVLVARTYLRHYAQSGGQVPAEYRPAAEVEHWHTRDPLDIAARRLAGSGVDPEPIREAVAEEIADVVALAMLTPELELADATVDAAMSVTVDGWLEPL